jgi:hypothetical protein
MMSSANALMVHFGFKQTLRNLVKGLSKDSNMPTGTDTIFFIHSTKCPLDVRQHTCKLFVLIDLRNHNLDMSDTPSVVTKSNILEAPVQRLLIFQLSKFCSTVLFQLQLAVS